MCVNVMEYVKVTIVGRIVEMKHFGSFMRIGVDDGTALVTCVQWFNRIDSQEAPPGLAIGVMVTVQGKVEKFRGVPQVNTAHVYVEDDPNLELQHWLEAIQMYQVRTKVNKAFDALFNAN
jgi:RecG-like helicase